MARTWLLGAVSMVTIAAGATDATPASTPAARGQELFVRSWIAEDPQAGEDGLGPYFNAESCVACHGTGGVGGSGGVAHNARLVASMSSVQPLPRFRVDGAPDLEAELLRLAAAKADQRSVDAALDGKVELSLLKHTAANPNLNPNPNPNPNPNQVDLSLLKHKADRSFCEALLSRFSIEVG